MIETNKRKIPWGVFNIVAQRLDCKVPNARQRYYRGDLEAIRIVNEELDRYLLMNAADEKKKKLQMEIINEKLKKINQIHKN